MKSHPRSRVYVGGALKAQDDAAAFIARQSIHAVADERYELPPIPRDWRLVVAVCGIGVGLAGLFVTLLIALIGIK